MADPLLLALAAGCTLLSVDTRVEVEGDVVVEQVRADIRADGACRSIDVVLPPGVSLWARKARARLSDDTGHPLDEQRWEHVGRDASGVAHEVLHVPELIRGDAVRLDLERRWVGRGYRWAPGLDGAQWAEVRLPVDALAVLTGELQGDRRSRWISRPTPTDGLSIAGPAPSSGPDGAPGSLTPAEAVARASAWALLPDRPDLDLGASDPVAVGAGTASDVARALVAATSAGPTPLRLGRILPEGAPVAPGQALAPIAATIDDDVARLWAHPDQRWSAGWRVLIDGRVLDAVAAPAGEGPRLDAPASLSRTLELRLPPGGNPQVELVPGRGSSAVQTDLWRLADPSRTRLRAIPVPPGARIVEVGVAEGSDSRAIANRTGDQVLLLAATGEDPVFTVVMELPDAPACGETPTLTGVTLTALEVRGDGADVRRDGGWWWLDRWNDVPLLSERARVVAGLHGRFNRRSIPEPGLPLRLRSRLDGWGLAAELAGALRARAVVAELPADPRWPRPLMKARRSGVVTPVEAALIVRAYALQSKLEADWALVRPASEGPGHDLCPIGYDAGLVRIIHEGKTRWIDPGCTACAPFEVRPELLGASAIGPWVDGTPEPPEGHSMLRIEDGVRVTWTLTGPAALELRRWLEVRPSEAREETLAERLAGSGARLVSATGVSEAGAPIEIVAEAADSGSIPEPAELLLPEPRADGSLFFAWTGHRGVTWLDAGSEAVDVGLVHRGRTLSADKVAAVRASLGRPFRPDPPPDEAGDGEDPAEATPE